MIQSLSPTSRLNDDVINFFSALFSIYSAEIMPQTIVEDVNSIKSTFSKKKTTLKKVKKIVIPYITSSHFFVIELMIDGGSSHHAFRYTIYNSWKEFEFTKERLGKIKSDIVKYLNARYDVSLLQEKQLGRLEPTRFRPGNVPYTSHVGYQEDPYNCGIYAILNMFYSVFSAQSYRPPNVVRFDPDLIREKFTQLLASYFRLCEQKQHVTRVSKKKLLDKTDKKKHIITTTMKCSCSA